MTGPGEPTSRELPRWLPWTFLGLLVLPFHPLWLDFEQVRRGLLLLLGGALWLCWPGLGRARGEGALAAFVGWLAVAAVISVRSLRPWEAAHELAHWVALGAVLRLGAAAPGAFALPLAALLLLTSAFGLGQRLGLPPLWGYGVDKEPVSVFGNLNVAAEWTAIAATAVAVLGSPRPWLWRAALVLAGAYLAVNGSRSGLVALPAGLALLLLLRRRAGGWLPLALALAGAGLGTGLVALRPLPLPADAAAVAAAADRDERTIDVRLAIAQSCGQLFAERPLFGFGPGQFAVQYPRVRSQREIEHSTHGRTLATEVRTAHDDWLELLVEGGLPALCLFGVLLFALQRGHRDKTRLLPAFVLLLLMFVRAPLGNAPAVAVVFLLCGSAAQKAAAAALPARRPAAAWALRLLGLLLLALGLGPVVANTAFAPYQLAAARNERPRPVAALAAAIAWMPWEPRWHQLLLQERIAEFEATLDHDTLAAAQATAAALLRLRPHDPVYLRQAAEAVSFSDLARAEALLGQALAIDPPNPEARILRSEILLQSRRYDEAIATVVVAPHRVLQQNLVHHLRGLEARARDRGDAEGARRCAYERSVLDVLETLGDESPGALAATTEHLRALLAATSDAGRSRQDLRPYALAALHCLALGDAKSATEQARAAQKYDLRLQPWQKAQLGGHLARLLRDPAWAPLLR
ncbi:MAG: tetratricopeptide repeat protein [Planctomycetes bacterium]|nr:tetratricopeptide repeat protein [Planctomycetota bacterium]